MAEQAFCRCDARTQATVHESFHFDARYKGWIFPNDPLRSPVNPWRSEYFGTENHNGEPTVWVTCPFCGHDLPFVNADPPPPANFCSDEPDGN